MEHCGGGEGGEAQAGGGGVLEVGAGVGDVDKGHDSPPFFFFLYLFCFFPFLSLCSRMVGRVGWVRMDPRRKKE